jgi:chorismate mutase
VHPAPGRRRGPPAGVYRLPRRVRQEGGPGVQGEGELTEQEGSTAGSARTLAGEPAAAIDALRRRIDELDEQLVVLLNARAGCALAIGEIKQAIGLEIYQPDRERQVLHHVRTLNRGPLDDEAIARLFERIIDEARRLERIAKESGSGRRSGAAERDE